MVVLVLRLSAWQLAPLLRLCCYVQLICVFVSRQQRRRRQAVPSEGADRAAEAR